MAIIGEWKFNGDATDSSGNGNDGTVTGASLTTGRFNKSETAYDLNGSSDFITIPDSAELSFGNGSSDTPFSINVWVNMDDATTFDILDKTIADDSSEEYNFGTSAGDDLAFYCFDSDTLNRIGVRTNTGFLTALEGSWIMLTVTYNGNGAYTDIKLYCNGEELTGLTDISVGSYTAMHSGAGDLLFGKRLSFATGYANGKIDDVIIYDKELSATEVADLYGLTGTALDIPMIGSTEDLSGNNNSGVLVGSPSLTTDKDGRKDRAYTLDGSTQGMYVSDTADLEFGNGSSDSAFSVACWIKFDDVSGCNVVSKANSAGTLREYLFGFRGTDILKIELYNNGGNTVWIGKNTSSTLTAKEGEWCLYGFTYDGSGNESGLKVYINGEEESVTSNSSGSYTAMTGTSANVEIGNNTGGFSNGIDGDLGRTSVFNKELSAEEFKQLYNEIKPQYQPLFEDCVGYWDFNKDAKDVIGGINGTVTGATLTTDKFNVTDNAYEFNGSTNIIDVGALGLAGDTSLICVFNPDTISSRQFLGSAHDSGGNAATCEIGVEITTDAIGSDGEIRVIVGGGDPGLTDWQAWLSGLICNLNEWNYLAISCDGSTINVNLNGATASTTQTTTIASDGFNYIIGRPGILSALYFNGTMSMYGLWSRALTTDEMAYGHQLFTKKKIYPFIRGGRD